MSDPHLPNPFGTSRDPALPRLDLLLASQTELPLGELEREFFISSWQRGKAFCDRSDRLRITPLMPGAAPTAFAFEVDCRYKRRASPESPVELVDGTLHGQLIYRPDPYDGDADTTVILILIDQGQGLWHPNYSRRHGLLCSGDLPAAPIPLDDLLLHIYSILTYQNVSTRDPADRAAAHWFATEPDARVGLEQVEPLFSSGEAR